MNPTSNDKLNEYIYDIVKADIALFDRIEQTNQLEPIEALDKEHRAILKKHLEKNAHTKNKN